MILLVLFILLSLRTLTDSQLTPARTLGMPPTENSLYEQFIQAYPVYRERFKCEVALCGYEFMTTSNITETHSCCDGCSCDDQCARYGDCCPDKIEHLSEPGKYPIGGLMECHKTSLKKNPYYATLSYKFISKCELSFTDKVTIEKCEYSATEDLETVVPVSNRITKETFKNIHCAICNNVSRDDIIYWTVNLTCTEAVFLPRSLTDVVFQVLESKNCNMLFKPPAGYMPSSCKQVISSCNVTGKWDRYDPMIEVGCAAYLSQFSYFFENYKNIFCFICNIHYSDNTTYCGAAKWHPQDVYPVSFTALLDFRPLQMQPSNTEDVPFENCSNGFVFDHHQQRCLEIVCPNMTEFVDGKCEKLLSFVEGACLEAYIRINPSELIDGDIIDNSIFRYFYEVTGTCNQQGLYANLYYQPTYDFGRGISAREYFVMYITTDDVSCVDVIVDLDETVLELGDFDYSVKASLQVYDVLSELVRESGEEGVVDIGGLLRPAAMVSMHICPSLKFSVPLLITKFLVCPMIYLRIQNSTEILGNRSVYFPELDLVLSEKDYKLARHNEIMVCTEDYIPATKSRTVQTSKKTNNQIVSSLNMTGLTAIVCVCCSILCLVVTLAIYIFLPPLRTQPGINNMCLSFSLFIALVLFQFGADLTQDSTVCTGIGMSIHFFWLNNMFWMNVCCYHMFRIFGNLRLSHLNTASIRTTSKYACYCLLLSSVIVSVNISWSLGTNKNGSFGYGKRANMCYITSLDMVALTMTLPTGVVVIFNILMYIRVLCRIGGSRFQSASSVRNRQFFSVYVKLSTVTGIAWLSFIPVYFIRHVVFEMIFIVLVTSQGIFILLAFICNKRVFGLLKDRLSSRDSLTKKWPDSSSNSKLTVISSIAKS